MAGIRGVRAPNECRALSQCRCQAQDMAISSGYRMIGDSAEWRTVSGRRERSDTEQHLRLVVVAGKVVRAEKLAALECGAAGLREGSEQRRRRDVARGHGGFQEATADGGHAVAEVVQ